MGDSAGPIWGGVPGSGTRPRRMGGDGGGVGNSGAVSETKATVSVDGKEKENPLLEILKAKILPERETNEPVNGLLYFLFEGKHKLKDLELMYKNPASTRLILDFQR